MNNTYFGYRQSDGERCTLAVALAVAQQINSDQAAIFTRKPFADPERIGGGVKRILVEEEQFSVDVPVINPFVTHVIEVPDNFPTDRGFRFQVEFANGERRSAALTAGRFLRGYAPAFTYRAILEDVDPAALA